MELIMTILRSLIKTSALVLLTITFLHNANAKPTKASNGIVENHNKTINKGKGDKFDYSHTFYREKKIKNKDGKSEVKREYVTQTLPGEELLGVATYTYTYHEPAKEIVFTLPLPKEVIYVQGSATDEKHIWFSADGGKNWSRFRSLRVTEKDGTKRIATGNDVTHLQWRMANALNKGDTGKLEYKIVIR